MLIGGTGQEMFIKKTLHLLQRSLAKGLSPLILNKGSKAKARADDGCPVEGRWRTPAGEDEEVVGHLEHGRLHMKALTML